MPNAICARHAFLSSAFGADYLPWVAMGILTVMQGNASCRAGRGKPTFEKRCNCNARPILVEGDALAQDETLPMNGRAVT